MFLIAAEPDRPVLPPAGFRIALRSAFRQGEWLLQDSGITVIGQEQVPLAGLPHFTQLLGGGLLTTLAGTTVVQARKILGMGKLQSFVIGGGGLVIGAAMLGLILFLQQRQRRPGTMHISWEQVLEVQIHPRLQWAVLCYAPAEKVITEKSAALYLPVNGLSPSGIGMLAEAIRHYAPKSVQREAMLFDRQRWVRRIGLFIMLMFSFSAFLLTLVRLMRKLLFH